MVGCQPDSPSLETVRPYLECMGRNIIPCGAPGTGSATKLCNNLALATQMIGVCEAMNLGEALGVDPTVLASVMNQSTAGCWSSQVNNPHPAVALAKGGTSPASREYAGGFAASLMLKDLGLAVAAADDAGVATPLAATSKELYRLVRAHGLGGKDFSVMLKFLRGS
jgi:3-hydroxyisobutyrate dehydrogenase